MTGGFREPSGGGGGIADAYAIDLLNYGIPTGATDGTAAAQAALDAAGTGGLPAAIYFPWTPAGYTLGSNGTGLVIPPGVRLYADKDVELIVSGALAAPLISLQAGGAYVGLEIAGGIWIATANTNAAVTAIIDLQGESYFQDLDVHDLIIVNSPKHAVMAGGETTITNYRKAFRRLTVLGHGTSGGGYGIYCDYLGGVIIEDPVVEAESGGTNGDDAVEMGHSGPQWLSGVNAHMELRGGDISGGAVQFPFSDDALISGVYVHDSNSGAGGIQNDANEADNVTISDVILRNITPSAGYAAINVYGNAFTVTHFDIEVTTLGGVHSPSTSGSIIGDGKILSTSTAASNPGAAVSIGGGGGNTVHDVEISGTNPATAAGGGFAYAIAASDSGSTYHHIGIGATCFRSVQMIGNNNTFDHIQDAAYNPGPVVTGTGNSIERSPGFNPVGKVVVAVPASGTAIAAVHYDRTFYITASTAAVTITLETAAITIPVAACVAVLVPAGQVFTPTYTVAYTNIVIGN